ncbi:hypothetical protein ACHAW5_000703 [Stephanodiscus triporus]|uniref:Uncharacterized protein n=1 Tax=Stephanodiscus triporus TaxID=2934178 RepID=A0ABD3P216_9STRA
MAATREPFVAILTTDDDRHDRADAAGGMVVAMVATASPLPPPPGIIISTTRRRRMISLKELTTRAEGREGIDVVEKETKIAYRSDGVDVIVRMMDDPPHPSSSSHHPRPIPTANLFLPRAHRMELRAANVRETISSEEEVADVEHACRAQQGTRSREDGEVIRANAWAREMAARRDEGLTMMLLDSHDDDGVEGGGEKKGRGVATRKEEEDDDDNDERPYGAAHDDGGGKREGGEDTRWESVYDVSEYDTCEYVMSEYKSVYD